MTTPCKRGPQAHLPRPQLTAIPDDLGECIAQYTMMVRELGWERFLRERRGRGDFSDLGGVDQPACRLLRQYCHRGRAVVLLDKQYTEGQRREALDRESHKSMMVHVPFF